MVDEENDQWTYAYEQGARGHAERILKEGRRCWVAKIMSEYGFGPVRKDA